MSCLFCRIVAREIPGTVVHEDADTLAFRDVSPQAPTHFLVIPKKHVTDLSEAAGDPALLGKTLAAAAAVAKSQGLGDYRVVVNKGAGAGQSVFHLHLHLLAGRAFTWPPG